jgi:hypothetical protein
MLDGAMMARLMACMEPPSEPATPVNQDFLEQMMLEYTAAMEVAACGAGPEMLEVAQAIAEQQIIQPDASQSLDQNDPCQMMQAVYDAQMQILMNPDLTPTPGPM